MQYTSKFSCGEAWKARTAAALRLVAATGRPAVAQPLPSDPQSLRTLLDSLIADKPVPAVNPDDFPLQADPPPLNESEACLCVLIPVRTKRSDTISVEVGGILYEDPFWAILAAAGLSMKPSLALPSASNNEGLWAMAATAAQASRPQVALAALLLPSTGTLPRNGRPTVRLVEFTGQALTALRSRGMQSLPFDEGFYSFDLFAPRPKP
jgi:hypothetical protein